MPSKRVFISSRIAEMRDYREAAIRAIEAAGMEPIYFDSTDPSKRFPLKPGVSVMRQLLDAVRTSDAFVGLYGRTLNDNWKAEGETKRSMELEYETAQGIPLPSFCYVAPPGTPVDQAMSDLRKQMMQNAVEFLGTPDELEADLREKLATLQPRLFISYSSKDQAFVGDLDTRLKQSGHHVWLNTESIAKGGRWHDQMVAGLRDTDVLILVVSKNSIASQWVTEEWQTFLKSGKRILPILIDETAEAPREINELEMIKSSHANWYYKLLKAIEQNL